MASFTYQRVSAVLSLANYVLNCDSTMKYCVSKHRQIAKSRMIDGHVEEPTTKDNVREITCATWPGNQDEKGKCVALRILSELKTFFPLQRGVVSTIVIIMSKGYQAIKAKSDGSDADKDKFFLKNVKYYCMGRGCRHKGAPEYKPTAISFYIKGSNCSHKEVWDRIDDVLPLYPGAKIEDIQFVPLGVHLDSIGTDNRWVITLNSIGARNRIAGTSVHLMGQKITLRRYDDIIQLEFRKCSRSSVVQSMVTRIKELNNDIEKA